MSGTDWENDPRYERYLNPPDPEVEAHAAEVQRLIEQWTQKFAGNPRYADIDKIVLLMPFRSNNIVAIRTIDLDETESNAEELRRQLFMILELLPEPWKAYSVRYPHLVQPRDGIPHLCLEFHVTRGTVPAASKEYLFDSRKSR